MLVCLCVPVCVHVCDKGSCLPVESLKQIFRLDSKSLFILVSPLSRTKQKKKEKEIVDIQQLHHGTDWIFLLVIFALCT